MKIFVFVCLKFAILSIKDLLCLDKICHIFLDEICTCLYAQNLCWMNVVIFVWMKFIHYVLCVKIINALIVTQEKIMLVKCRIVVSVT